MRFRDREEAGKKLAEKLRSYAGRSDVRLFALPRGGVVVGQEVAAALELPLDLIITRKIGAPYNEEYAVGALAETGDAVWNEGERAKIGDEALQPIIAKEREELKRRVHAYRGGRALPDLSGLTALIVDDGLATGLTMRAAIMAARNKGAAGVAVAVPHGASDSLKELKEVADEVIALSQPILYMSVGGFYEQFPQVTDEEVQMIMKDYGNK